MTLHPVRSNVLISAERKFREIFDTNLVGVGFGDASGVLREINDYYLNLAGYSREEFEAGLVRWDVLTPPEFLTAQRAYMDQLRRTGTMPPFEKPWTRRDGSRVWVMVWINSLDGSDDNLASIVIDITERKRKEAEREQLLESEQLARQYVESQRKRLLCLFQQAPALLCTLTGPDLVYELANEEYLRFIGNRTIIGKPLLEAVPNIDPRTHEILMEVYRTGKRYIGREHAITADWSATNQVTTRYFNFIFEPFLDISGKTEGVIVLAQDITESKSMEAKLRLSERLASLGTLAAGIGHEINNPLAYASLSLELMEDNLKTLENSASPATILVIRDRMSKIKHGLERVQSIVQDLKIFSRSDSADTVTAVDLHKVLDLALDMAGNEIRHRAHIVKEYGSIPYVNGNESRLGQVFLNLLVNATQALQVGRVNENIIRISTCVGDDARVRVTISDSGEGIAPDKLKRIFDPFFTTKPVGSGTGLGLAICHGIVAALGGEIQVESEVGRGTAFTVIFPAERVALPMEAAPDQSAADARSETLEARILIIEDGEYLRQTIVEALRERYHVESAKTGSEAFALLRTGRRFDLILCDLMLTDTTGMDIYAEIQKSLPGLERKIIFMTGGAFTDRAAEFLDRIENYRLMKPFTIAELMKLIQSALRPPS